MKKNTTVKEEKSTRVIYRKPVLVEQGTLTGTTLNSTVGADPENFGDNIVWGN